MDSENSGGGAGGDELKGFRRFRYEVLLLDLIFSLPFKLQLVALMPFAPPLRLLSSGSCLPVTSTVQSPPLEEITSWVPASFSIPSLPDSMYLILPTLS